MRGDRDFHEFADDVIRGVGYEDGPIRRYANANGTGEPRFTAQAVREAGGARGAGDRDDHPLGRQFADGVVTRIGDEDLPARVDVDARRLIEMGLPRWSVVAAGDSRLACDRRDVAVHVDSPDDVVAAVGDEDAAVGSRSQSSGRVEACQRPRAVREAGHSCTARERAGLAGRGHPSIDQSHPTRRMV